MTYGHTSQSMSITRDCCITMHDGSIVLLTTLHQTEGVFPRQSRPRLLYYTARHIPNSCARHTYGSRPKYPADAAPQRRVCAAGIEAPAAPGRPVDSTPVTAAAALCRPACRGVPPPPAPLMAHSKMMGGRCVHARVDRRRQCHQGSDDVESAAPTDAPGVQWRM